jgi:uncharacterized protein with ParB-like and HNH nuclease domain
MATKNLPLLKIVSYLNDESSDGFWLPAIQRPFVWKEEQICNLFDSILRGYPISTLLIWTTRQEIGCRKFVDEYKPNMKLSDMSVKTNSTKKSIVLDGQQRLQSLLIGLKGRYDGKELFLDVSSFLDDSKQNECAFVFVKPQEDEQSFPRIRFRHIVYADSRDAKRYIFDIARKSTKQMPLFDETNEDTLKDKIDIIVDTINRTFSDNKGEDISYIELDGTNYRILDKEKKIERYSLDEVVEIFIRVNSGGTKLGKSDLLFSLIKTNWSEVTEKMEKLLERINQLGYAFDQDFVLKTCLTLLDKRAKYNPEKFRETDTLDQIQKNWESIGDAIKNVVDFLYNKTFIRNDKALPSPNALIPIIYLHYHYKGEFQKKENDIREYLLRSLLSSVFTSNVDYTIDSLIDQIKKQKTFDLKEIFTVIQDKTNHNIEITEQRLLEMGYKHENNPLIFSLWYDVNYRPSYEGNKPHVDHIFPQALLKGVKELNAETNRLKRKYSDEKINKLANCMLLEAHTNWNKSDAPPKKWLKEQSEDFLEKHLIPRDTDLWELERYEDFIAAREEKIKQKFKNIIKAPAET